MPDALKPCDRTPLLCGTMLHEDMPAAGFVPMVPRLALRSLWVSVGGENSSLLWLWFLGRTDGWMDGLRSILVGGDTKCES
jgi:hypothetical protein